MWQCPDCSRRFKTANQSHSCTDVDMGELFVGKPDDLVLAFDAILQAVVGWEPCDVGTATHSIVFTNKKAWLIIKPMSKVLDVKFYLDEPLESGRFKKVTHYFGKYAHHVRVAHMDEVDVELIELLRLGYVFALK